MAGSSKTSSSKRSKKDPEVEPNQADEPLPSKSDVDMSNAEDEKTNKTKTKGKSKSKKVKTEARAIKKIVGARIETEAFWRRVFSKSCLLGTHFNEVRGILLKDTVRFPRDKYVFVEEFEKRLGEKVSSEKKDEPLPLKKRPKLASQDDPSVNDKDVDETEADDEDEPDLTGCAGSQPDVTNNSDKAQNKEDEKKSKPQKDKNRRKLVQTITITTEAKMAMRCLIERIRWELSCMVREQDASNEDIKNLDPFSVEGNRFILNKIHEAGFDNCFTEMALYTIDHHDVPQNNPFTIKWEQDISADLHKEISSKIKNGTICNFASIIIAKLIAVIINHATKYLWSKKAQGLNLALVENIILDYIEYGRYFPGENRRMPHDTSNKTDEEISILHLVRKYTVTIIPPKEKKPKTSGGSNACPSMADALVKSMDNLAVGESKSTSNLLLTRSGNSKSKEEAVDRKKRKVKEEHSDDNDDGQTDAQQSADESGCPSAHSADEEADPKADESSAESKAKKKIRLGAKEKEEQQKASKKEREDKKKKTRSKPEYSDN